MVKTTQRKDDLGGMFKAGIVCLPHTQCLVLSPSRAQITGCHWIRQGRTVKGKRKRGDSSVHHTPLSEKVRRYRETTGCGQKVVSTSIWDR